MSNILVIEDNPTNLELMIYLLRAFGHSVTSARDGASGVRIAEEAPHDLIICDIQIPALDGYGVVARLKQNPSVRTTPIVAVTALAMVGDRDRMIAAGFDGYIPKPIEPESFVGHVEEFLSLDARNAAVAARSQTQPKPEVADVPIPPEIIRRIPAITILTVDNNNVNLDFIGAVLARSRCSVLAASSVADALVLLRNERIDLIISDIHMPAADGFDLLQACKADPTLATIPFVFLSSSVSSVREQLRAEQLGALRFLARPIEPEDLLREIADVATETMRS